MNIVIQGSDGDLDINDILGSQTRDRGGANMIDTQCQAAKATPQIGSNLAEFERPPALIGNDYRAIILVIR